MNVSRTKLPAIELARIRISNHHRFSQQCFKLRSAAAREGFCCWHLTEFSCESWPPVKERVAAEGVQVVVEGVGSVAEDLVEGGEILNVIVGDRLPQ